MVYTGINLMLPTYGIAKTRLPDFVESAESTCADQDNIFYTFMLHKGDIETEQYLINRLGKTNRLSLHYEDEDLPHLAKFWNRLYRETKFQDKGLMISMVGDDMIFQSEWWDELLLDECNKMKGIGVWFGDDCKNTHDILMVNIFTTRLIVESQNPFPFMCEAFPCDDMDWVWDHVSRRLGIRYYLESFKLFHNHATFKEENMDKVWERLRLVFPTVEIERNNMEKYVSERIEKLRESMPELKKTMPKVLFVCMGRYGDIIHAALHSNKLISMGYDITWITIPYYIELIEATSRCNVIKIEKEHDLASWAAMSMKDIRSHYVGYDYYVNAQPGAPENHDTFIGSGLSMIDFVSKLISDSGIKYKGFNNECVLFNLPYTKEIISNKPICIIAPEVISTKAVWPNGGVVGLYHKYKDKYDVRLLVKDLPDIFILPKENYIYDRTFAECMLIIKDCELFIGQDSGLAWAALYSNCKKIIYHSKKRVSETNMMFNQLNDTYEDVIL
jgi:hypothetical protein